MEKKNIKTSSLNEVKMRESKPFKNNVYLRNLEENVLISAIYSEMLAK